MSNKTKPAITDCAWLAHTESLRAIRHSRLLFVLPVERSREIARPMRLPENETEGNNEELVNEIVADVREPVPANRWGSTSWPWIARLRCVITSLGEVAHHSAAAIDEYRFRVGAVERQWGILDPFNGQLWTGTDVGAQRSPRRNGLRRGAVSLEDPKPHPGGHEWKQDSLRTCRLLLLSSSGAQPPHFVAKRSLKALITESIAANTRAPSMRLAAACRSITDS